MASAETTYNIGQLRRNQISSYSTKVAYRTDLMVNTNSSIDFYDPAIIVSDGGQVSLSNTYYLRFRVKQRTDSVQDFTVKLKNEGIGDDEDNTQSLRTFSAKSGVDYTTFELIFTPNKAYSNIILELKRTVLDFSTTTSGKSGRIMTIEVLDFYVIDNIINSYLKSHYSGLDKLKKIGIQGPPGLMFTIDGEEFKLGKSGIYELYNEKIQISYLGFIIKDSNQITDGKDFFILDFKY